MADIRSYIRDTLLDPLSTYPTAIQDTMLELITEKLEKLYQLTVAFPEIVTPNSTRLDILKLIANQFLFTIRDEADLEEQINILDNILYVYNKRGSIDTIENMWKYYGGDLPRDVQVIIPSYNLFRYNISPFSGSHVFQDGNLNRTGIYEIKLTNNTYPIHDLKEFMLKELVAAGNLIYFTTAVTSDVRDGMTPSYFKYDVNTDYFLDIQMNVSPTYHGLLLSGPTNSLLSGDLNLLNTTGLNSLWSGKENIWVDITHLIDVDHIVYEYLIDKKGFYTQVSPSFNIIDESMKLKEIFTLQIYDILYCTPSSETIYIQRDLYNVQGERVKLKHFILGESLLGESLGYEPA